VIPRFAGALDAAVYSEAVDGRPFFVLPWNDQVLVGTTEVADQGDPAKTAPAAEEIDYLLSSLVKLFPRLKLSVSDIHYSFAGVRPLPFSPKGDLAGVSRKHYLHDHSDEGAVHMISVIGGKLTTAAELARQCAAKLGIAAKPAAGPAVIAQADADTLFDSWVDEMAKAGGLNEHSARSIVEWHGPRSLTIARAAADSTALRAPLCSHTPHIVAEAVDALTAECAITLGDILLRRVPVALGPCWSQACSREATARIAAVLEWDDRRAAAELEAFENERAAFLRKPGSPDALQPAAD
jgi:glycerol-3-phosphate dehydrogenase